MTNKKLKRGEVYFALLGKPIGSVQGEEHPVVVLQNDVGNEHSSTIIVATITSKIYKKKSQPTHVVVEMEGLSQKSIVQLEQITTIDKQQLVSFMGKMSDSDMERIDKAIRVSLSV